MYKFRSISNLEHYSPIIRQILINKPQESQTERIRRPHHIQPIPIKKNVNMQQVLQALMLLDNWDKPSKRSESRQKSSSSERPLRPVHIRRTILVRPKRIEEQRRSQQHLTIQQRIQDQNQLSRFKALQSERAQRNIAKLRNAFWYVQRFRRNMYNLILERKQQIKDTMPTLIYQFTIDCEVWLRKICQPILEKPLNVQIINQKITNNVLQKRTQTLKDTIKRLLTSLLLDSIPQSLLQFLSQISNDQCHQPDNYFIGFELNRLNYTYHGALAKMNEEKQYMLYCTNILFRILFFRILGKYQDQNIKIIASVLYQIIMKFIDISIQQNNMKFIPKQFKIKERSPFYYQLEQFISDPDQIRLLQQARQSNSDKPLLYPLYYQDIISEDPSFIETCNTLLRGFCQQVGQEEIREDVTIFKKQRKNQDNLSQRYSTIPREEDRIVENEQLDQRFENIIQQYQLMRQTPFQTVGANSFLNPLDPQMQQQPSSSSIGQFMNDYDQFKQQPQRPKSRELDLMNLLLIGSMDKSKKKDQFQSLDSLLFNQDIQRQPQQQFMSPQMQQQPQYFPQQQQFPYPQQYPQQYYQPPQQQLQQDNFQYPPTQNNPYSPPTLSGNGQLIVNGQMGVNVGQQQQVPPELQQGGNNRVLQYIQKQNEMLAQLTQNMAYNREKEVKDEKQKLMERIKQLEMVNQQDAYYNNLQDEYPTYKQPYYRRPMPMMPQNQFQAIPPAYIPPYQQQQQKSKSEILNMLLMLKEMKNQKRKKNKKRKQQMEVINDNDAMDSFTSPSEESIEYIQKPRQQKIKPPPPAYEASEDLQRLKQLGQMRFVRSAKRGWIMLRYLKALQQSWKEKVQEKKEQVKQQMPGRIEEFVQETQNWQLKILAEVIEYIMKTPKLNVQIVQEAGKKISDSALKANVQKLKEVLKKIISAIYDNSQGLSESIIGFLSIITHNYYYLPDSYFLKFELNRLNYSYYGGLKDMNQNKQYMMYCTNVLIRILIMRIGQMCLTIKGIEIKEIHKINVKTITSALYEIIMDFIRGNAAIQPDNFKKLPIENQVKERKEFYYTISQFEQREEDQKRMIDAKTQKLDEPIVTPLYSQREMTALFDEQRMEVSRLLGMFDGWCETIGEQVTAYYQSVQQERLDLIRQRREDERQQYGMKKDHINVLVKKRKEEFLQISQEMEELKAKIKLKTEENQKQQDEYERKKQQYNIK